jgi:dienelactone hydrolase
MPLFDAGVPLQDLPWGVEGSRRAVASRQFTYHDGDVALEAFFAWDAEAAAGHHSGGLPGVLVAHTAIGPQEVFIHSCCDALARAGYAAFALDLFGTGECVFDKQVRDGILGPLREDRSKYAARVQAGYDAMCAQPEVDESRGVGAIGFCLGGQAVLDLARAKTAPGLKGVVSFHGSLDNPSTLPSPPSSSSSASVLILHGDDDPFNPPERMAECTRGLTERGIEYEIHTFGGAKHAFTRPEKTKLEDYASGFGYQPRAAARSWAAARNFLAEVLK